MIEIAQILLLLPMLNQEVPYDLLKIFASFRWLAWDLEPLLMLRIPFIEPGLYSRVEFPNYDEILR